MFHIHSPKPWSKRGPTLAPILDEARYLERRALLKSLGFAGLYCALPSGARAALQDAPGAGARDARAPSTKWVPAWEPAGGKALYPARRNAKYTSERGLTPEDKASTHNNYYEFLPGRAGPVHELAKEFKARPWKLEIAGEVEEPRTIDVDDLVKAAPLEERIVRHRCVEAWSMVVPWTGLPLAALVRWCKPKPSAKYVRFVSFDKPEMAPGMRRQKSYPWPYFEGLRIDEALNELAFVVTGVYGHGLPVQFGAPVRVHVPWKYGYKSPKGIVKIEFTVERPKTFWSVLQPREYPFESNVDPRVAHPRWSQEQETDIGTGDRIRTRYLNGYEEFAGALYKKG